MAWRITALVVGAVLGLLKGRWVLLPPPIAVETAPTRVGIAIRPATQSVPYGHGARCPTVGRARRAVFVGAT